MRKEFEMTKNVRIEVANECEQITLEEWYERYKPVEFSTWDEFNNADAHKKWTLIEGDESEIYVIATGLRRANSLQWFLTEKGWKLKGEVEVPITEKDPEYCGLIYK